MNLPLSGIRYIRDYLDGSNINEGNHWVEIQAFSGATNIALNKVVTSPMGIAGTVGASIVNGQTASTNYVYNTIPNGAYGYLQVDLGSVNIIDTIKVWHYYADSRTYNRTKIEVSLDGIEWFNVRDYTIDGLYIESAAGLTIPITYTPDNNTGVPGNTRVLIVSGGGGGGMNMGGGGGAGGVISNPNVNLTIGTHSIIVGGGGRGAVAAGVWGNGTANNYHYQASQGYDSSALGLTAIGGGYGSTGYVTMTPNLFTPGNGGSGGGVSAYGAAIVFQGGTGTSGQGNNGGNYNGVSYYGGGGGGAGTTGVTGSPGILPNGGIGVLDDILGTPYYWGGGGGASGYSQNGGTGGLGGGGGGALSGAGGTGGLNNGTAGTAGPIVAWANVPGGSGGTNTGGGGGGGSHYNANNKGGDGGSGIVIIRYPTNCSIKATGGTVTIVGTDTVHTFYTSGQLVVTSNQVPPTINIIPDIHYENNVNISTDLNNYINTVSTITNYNLIGVLPTGLTFDNVTGIMSGSSTSVGTYQLNIDSTNQYGTSNIVSFNLIIDNPIAPVIANIPNQTFTQTSKISLDLSTYVTATNNDLVTYGLTGTLPTLLSFDSNTGIISGPYIQQSTTLLTFAAIDKDGITSKSFNLILNQVVITKRINALIVGGGGGGGTLVSNGYGGGGGGGAGGVIQSINTQLLLSSYTITVGAGGINNGSNSSFNSLIAIGGGAGGSGSNSGGYPGNGSLGGSGGGAGSTFTNYRYGTGGAGTGGQGNVGGSGYGQGTYAGAGGGGAGGIGAGTSSTASGGVGISTTVPGLSGFYGGGGAGGSGYINGTGGGVGGAGGGGNYNASGVNGTGGGGGGEYAVTTYGGSGVVKVTYKSDGTDGIYSATGGTVTYVGLYTVHTFTTGGTFTPTYVSAPVISAIPDVIYTNNISNTYDLSQHITSNGNVNYYYIDGQLPTGLVLDELTGIISGSSTQTGTYNLLLIVSNNFGNSSINFNIVISSPTAPVVGTVNNITSKAWKNINVDLSQYVTQTNLDPIISYGLVGNTLQGLNFNTSTGLLSGSPTREGIYNLGLYAIDKDGQSNTSNFTLTITPKSNFPIGDTGSFNLLTNTF